MILLRMKNQAIWIRIPVQIQVVPAVADLLPMEAALQKARRIRNRKKNIRKEVEKMSLHSYNSFGPSVEGIRGTLRW